MVLATPFGGLEVRVAGDALTGIRYVDGPVHETPASSALERQVAAELGSFFADPGHAFGLPLALQGTVFQRRVWERLRQIPPGTVCTYGALARELGTGARAIGNACRANPLPVVVPCHRVVGAHGLGGYAGATGGKRLAVKRWLLRHEGMHALA